METSDLSNAAFGRATRSCGAAVTIVGAAALVGWVAKHPVLLGFRASYIPMAPNTAMAFVAMGTGLLAVGGRRGAGSRLAAANALAVALICVLRLSEYATGVDIAVDRWFFRFPAAKFGLADVGKMSIQAAAAFVAACVAMASIAIPPRPARSGDVAGVFGLVAGGTGLVFSLGYLFSPNAPLLYGSGSIPMALNTSLGFVGLGIGLAAAAGPGAFPARYLVGPSIRARLLRLFLPLVIATVGAVAWLTHVVTTSAGASSAALSSAALATAATFLFALICERIARRVGRQLEHAEAELQRAHDELEVKVDERTGELSRANADLGRALHDIRAAHESLQVAHDDLKQAQSRMLQQAKMASLGQTAAGVAHEINNPLAFVTNNLMVLEREVTGLHDMICLYQQAEQTLARYHHDLHEKIAELAEEVDLPYVLENLGGMMDRSRVGLQRIQKIVQGLRDFAHLDEADLKEVDLNSGIRSTVDIMRSLAERQQVTLEVDLVPIPRLTCFPAKINMIVQSLISNAIDASLPGGAVVVRTRPAGGAIELEVSDVGSGIAAAIRDKVFDPFFTTKAIGKGTGLGLSISYGIVKDHGGTIDFESAPGQGTRFTVRLPVATPDGAPLNTDGPGQIRKGFNNPGF